MGMLQNRLQLAQLINFFASHAEYKGQIVGGVGKGNYCIGPFFG